MTHRLELLRLTLVWYPFPVEYFPLRLYILLLAPDYQVPKTTRRFCVFDLVIIIMHTYESSF